MAFPLYLAMTATEFASSPSVPVHMAWMACHFSSYGTGLCNLPQSLPENAMLIVNDRTSVQGHDPALIARQLQQAAEALKFSRVLLDLQRPENPETAAIAKAIAAALPCPVASSLPYAQELDGPVFLAPPPLHSSLEEYIRPWKGRELWLEAALDAETITLTANGSRIAPLQPAKIPEPTFPEPQLHCRYHIDASPQEAVFTLYRTEQTLHSLLQEAEALGVTCAVGLYQELGDSLQ